MRWQDASGIPLPDVLPTDSAAFAQFGQSTHDNGNAIALTVVRLAYQVATIPAEREDITGFVEAVHAAADKPERPIAAALVKQACKQSAQTPSPV